MAVVAGPARGGPGPGTAGPGRPAGYGGGNPTTLLSDCAGRDVWPRWTARSRAVSLGRSARAGRYNWRALVGGRVVSAQRRVTANAAGHSTGGSGGVPLPGARCGPSP